jgi:TonB family protein
MTPLFVLCFALFAAQATTPATASPAPSKPPAAQTTQQPAQSTQQPASPAPTTPTPDQAAPANPPSPDVSGIHQVGGGVTPPKALYQPEPKFSQLARKQKLSGVATVQLIVDTQGNPANVHIAKSIADTVGKNKKKQAAALSLDQAALDAVKQYKFAPATWHGKPVAVYLNVEVNFQIF